MIDWQTETFWCITTEPGSAPRIWAILSPVVTGISHHPSAHAHTDDALDHLDVAQSPRDEQFIKLGQSLTHVNPVSVTTFVEVQGQDRLGPGAKTFRLGRVVLNLRQSAKCRQRREKHVAQ